MRRKFLKSCQLSYNYRMIIFKCFTTIYLNKDIYILYIRISLSRIEYGVKQFRKTYINML